MEELRKKDRDSLLAEIQELRHAATEKPLNEEVGINTLGPLTPVVSWRTAASQFSNFFVIVIFQPLQTSESSSS